MELGLIPNVKKCSHAKPSHYFHPRCTAQRMKKLTRVDVRNVVAITRLLPLYCASHPNPCHFRTPPYSSDNLLVNLYLPHHNYKQIRSSVEPERHQPTPYPRSYISTPSSPQDLKPSALQIERFNPDYPIPAYGGWGAHSFAGGSYPKGIGTACRNACRRIPWKPVWGILVFHVNLGPDSINPGS